MPGRCPRSRLPRLALTVAALGSVMLLATDLAGAAITAGTKPPSHESEEAVRWGFVIGIGAAAALLLLCSLIGRITGKLHISRLVIGTDNRVSTSKTIPFTWTIVVAAGLVALVYASLIGHDQPLQATNDAGVVGQYALLFGGPLGAAILAKAIVNKQVAENPGSKSEGQPSATDLVTNDAGQGDLGDFQYVVFNLVALVYVVGTLLTDPAGGLPHVPDVLLGLTSVSAVGYIGKKALVPVGTVTGTLNPTSGPSGTTMVTITLDGLAPAEQPATTPWWVRFGDAEPGDLVAAAVTSGGARLERAAPAIDPAPQQPVNVTVTGSDGTSVTAGKYVYT